MKRRRSDAEPARGNANRLPEPTSDGSSFVNAEPAEDPFLTMDVLEWRLVPMLHAPELRALYCACSATLAIKSNHGWKAKLEWVATRRVCKHERTEVRQIVNNQLKPPCVAAYSSLMGVATWEHRLLPIERRVFCRDLRDKPLVWRKLLKAWTLYDDEPLAGSGSRSVAQWLAASETRSLKYPVPGSSYVARCDPSARYPLFCHVMCHVMLGIATCGTVVDARARAMFAWPNV